MKQCKRCGIEKNKSEFHKCKRNKDGLYHICKQCKLIVKPKEILPDGRKRCSKCKIEKDKNEFMKDKTSKDGLYSMCKQCKKEYLIQNRERLSANQRERHTNPKVRQQKQEYRKKNEKALALKQREYNLRPDVRQRKYSRDKQRRENDINYYLAGILRRRVLNAIHGGYKSGSAVRDLGCSIPELKIWLENQFLPGMLWENRGKGDGRWNIDHILPLSKFDLTDREQFLKVCHYTNLQPLWEKDNLIKGNKILVEEKYGR